MTKHLNILTSAYTMPKGQCILGALAIYMRKEFSLELFSERYDLLQLKAPRVLRTSVSRNVPKQLKRIFCLLVALTIYMGKEFSFEAAFWERYELLLVNYGVVLILDISDISQPLNV